jgi:hypothetical protein
MNYTANVVAGTTVTVTVKVGTLQANGTILWQVANVRSDGTLVDANGNAIQARYLQYSVTMTSTDPNVSPEFEGIDFTWA